MKMYKILRLRENEEFVTTKRFFGSQADLNDGFIHLSYGDQLDRTISKFFQDVSEVYILEIDPTGYNLKVENGFPHFYDEKLLYSSVVNTELRKIKPQ